MLDPMHTQGASEAEAADDLAAKPAYQHPMSLGPKKVRRPFAYRQAAAYDDDDFNPFVLARAIESGETAVSWCPRQASVRSCDDVGATIAAISAALPGSRVLVRHEHGESDGPAAFLVGSREGVVLVRAGKAGAVMLPGSCLILESRVAGVEAAWLGTTRAPPPEPAVHSDNLMIVSFNPTSGYCLQALTSIEAPLIRENYSPKALAGYDQALAQLKSETPFGRIAILDGPPGTGKSWMVRALITESGDDDCTHVLVPPRLVPKLMEPEFGAFLCMLAADRACAINLIIEDADTLLADRAELKAADRDGISALLNFGDGLLGQALDVRLTCTTNVPYEKLDAAVLRAGRLSAHVAVGQLTSEHATDRLKALAGEPDVHPPWRQGSEVTLADVYAEVERLKIRA